MNIFERAFSFALRRPRVLTTLFIFIFGLLAFGLKFAHLELDIYEVLDPNFPSSVRLSEMREKFQDVNSLHLVFKSRSEPMNANDVCKLESFFRHYSNNDSRVQSWLSPWRIRRPHSTETKLTYPTLLPDPCRLAPNASIEKDLALLDDTPWAPLLTDKKHQEFSVSLNFEDSELPSGKKHFDANVISEIKTQLDEFLRKEDSQLSYEISGQAAYRWYFHKIISRDAIFNLGIIILFLIFFRAFFGTWKSGLFFLFTLFYTVVCLYGLLCWIGIPLDILTNNLFLMTAIAGVADFLFVTASQEKHEWKQSFRDVILPGFFTTFTTFIGFWSLMISDISIIQRFGFAAGCGALLEWVSTFLVLPAFLESFHFEGRWIDLSKAWRPEWLKKSIHFKPNRKVTFVLCSLLFLSLWAGLNLNYSDTPTQNFPKNHPLRVAFQNLKQSRNWESNVYIVFRPETAPETQKIILEEIRKEPQVVWIESGEAFVNFLLQGIPQLERNLILHEASYSSIYKRYWQDDKTSRAMILMRSSSIDELNLLSGKIRNLCQSQCDPVGQNEVFREYSTKISSTLAESFLLSLVIVLGTLFILAYKKGFQNYMALAISVLWGPLIMIIVLWAFQIPISLITSVFLAVIVGMTGDNAIQFIFGGKDLNEGIENRGLASVLLSILLCLASLTFVGQTLIPVRILGVLFFLGFLATLFGDLWALKGLLSISKNK